MKLRKKTVRNFRLRGLNKCFNLFKNKLLKILSVFKGNIQDLFDNKQRADIVLHPKKDTKIREQKLKSLRKINLNL